MLLTFPYRVGSGDRDMTAQQTRCNLNTAAAHIVAAQSSSNLMVLLSCDMLQDSSSSSFAPRLSNNSQQPVTARPGFPRLPNATPRGT